MKELLKELGLSQEELQDRVVAHIAGQCLHGFACDEDGQPHEVPSSLHRQIQKTITDTTKQAIQDAIDPIIDPLVNEGIENVIFEKTNQWGEKTEGKGKGFKEFIADYVTTYLNTPVDYEGKTKEEASRRGGCWRQAHNSRVINMVDRHLQYTIEGVMKSQLPAINEILAEDLGKAAKSSLNEISKKLTVAIKSK